LCLQCLLILQYLYIFTFLHFIISPWTPTIIRRKQPRRKGEISYLIFWVLKRLAPFGAKILSVLIYPRPLAPNYLEHFIGSAPPLFILDLLLWIGSAYSFVYINSCLWLNKSLTNLTSSRQHHLQYIIYNYYRNKLTPKVDRSV